jgi:predicted nucleic acid-binding protein
LARIWISPAGGGCPQGRFVSRHLLDANIVGNITKPLPSETLTAWMADRADEDLFISSLTVAEIRRGILEKPAGKKRKELESWFFGPEGPQALFAGRVLPFDEKAGLVWARLMADGTASGRPRNPLDMIISAVGEVNDCVVVTDNEKDFAGLKIVNPLRVVG